MSEHPSAKVRHTRNAFWSVAQYFVSAAVMVVSIRIFRSSYGSELYGVYSLLMVVGSLNLLSGLGLSTATVRFLARQGKSPESDTDFLLGLLFAAVLSTVVVCVGFVLQDFVLEDVLHVPSSLLRESGRVYVLFLFSNLPIVFGQTGLALLDSMQLVSISSILQGLYSILYWGGILIVSTLGLPFQAIGDATALTAVIWCVCVAIVAMRQWGPLHPSWDRGNVVKSVRKQLGFGIQANVGQVISMLFEPLTKVVASHLLGVRDVGVFDLGLKAKGFVWGAFARALYPVFPLLAAEHSESRRLRTVEEIEQKLLILLVPVSIVVAGAAWPLAVLWIGRDVQAIASTIAVLTICYLFGSTLITPYYQALIVQGRLLRAALLQAINVFGNLFGILLTFQYLGYFALVVGSGAAIILYFAVGFHHQRNVLGIRLVPNRGRVVRLTFFGVIGGAISAFMGYALPAIAALLVVPLCTLFFTIVFYRNEGIVTQRDVERYFSGTPKLSHYLSSWLVKNPRGGDHT